MKKFFTDIFLKIKTWFIWTKVYTILAFIWKYIGPVITWILKKINSFLKWIYAAQTIIILVGFKEWNDGRFLFALVLLSAGVICFINEIHERRKAKSNNVQ